MATKQNVPVQHVPRKVVSVQPQAVLPPVTQPVFEPSAETVVLEPAVDMTPVAAAQPAPVAKSSFSFSPMMMTFVGISFVLIVVAGLGMYFWKQIQIERDENTKLKQKIENIGQLLIQHDQLIRTLTGKPSTRPPTEPDVVNQPANNPKPAPKKVDKPKKTVPAKVEEVEDEEDDDEEDDHILKKELQDALNAQRSQLEDLTSDQESVIDEKEPKKTE